MTRMYNSASLYSCDAITGIIAISFMFEGHYHSLPILTASAIVSGSTTFNVSGNNSDNAPEHVAITLNSTSGRDFEICARMGTCGAIIEPIRPKVEQNDIDECLRLVGNISVVYKYILAYDIVTENLPARNKISLSVLSSSGVKTNPIHAIPLNKSEEEREYFLPIRLSEKFAAI